MTSRGNPCCLGPPTGKHNPAPERAWTCDMPQSGWHQYCACCGAPKDRRLVRACCMPTHMGQPLLLVPTNWTAQACPRTRMDLRHATVWVASVLRALRSAQGQEAGARVLHAISHGTTPCCVPQTARQHVTPSERAQPCGVPHCRGGEPCCVRCVRPGGRLQACSAWMQVHDAPLGAPLG